jgi:hypothetical protein
MWGKCDEGNKGYKGSLRLDPGVASARETEDAWNSIYRGRKALPHLGRVEFVLSNDFDGDLSASLLLQSFVDVGESAVTHLLEEPIVFQTLSGVSGEDRNTRWSHLVDRHLLSLRTLLCDYPLCLFSIVW